MATTNPNQYVLLDENVQTILGQSNQPFGFTIGQDTSLVAISSFVLFIFLAVSGVATIGRILYALGLKTANSDNEAKITMANKIITSSLFALLMSFSLVLFFLAINPDIVTGNVDFSKVKVGSNAVANTGTNTQTPAGTGAGSANENALRERFRLAGVLINKGACATPSSTDCTNVAGLPEETIAMVITLKSSCGCEVVITGGTEAGHQTHGAGKRPVDLRIINSLDPLYSFIKSNSGADLGETRNINSGAVLCRSRYKWPSAASFTFCDEPENGNNPNGARHWHVS